MAAKINTDWLKTRTQQINKQKQESSRFVKLQNGENKIEIDLSVLPYEQPPKGTYAARQIYTTTTQKTIAGKSFNLLLSASTTLDALIIQALSSGFNPFTLIKVGEGINTRYAIKELETK